MKTFLQTLALPVVNGGTVLVGDLAGLAVGGKLYLQLSGAFSASYVVEISADNGATWYTAHNLLTDVSTGSAPASPITAPALLAGPDLPLTRVRCSAYVSGTPVLWVWAPDTRST